MTFNKRAKCPEAAGSLTIIMDIFLQPMVYDILICIHSLLSYLLPIISCADLQPNLLPIMPYEDLPSLSFITKHILCRSTFSLVYYQRILCRSNFSLIYYQSYSMQIWLPFHLLPILTCANQLTLLIITNHILCRSTSSDVCY